MIANSLEHACWHEAGHAIVAHLLGVPVTEIQVVTLGNGLPTGRVLVGPHTDDQRVQIACGGHAIERILWHHEQLVGANGQPLTEKQLVDLTIDKAAIDKIRFFGADYRDSNGDWPRELDHLYLYIGSQVAGRLAKDAHIAMIDAVATYLIQHGQMNAATFATVVDQSC